MISFILTGAPDPLAEKQPCPLMLQPPCVNYGTLLFGLNALHFFVRLKPHTDIQKFHLGAIRSQDTFPKFDIFVQTCFKKHQGRSNVSW